MSRILVVDDNPDILDALDLLLTLHNYQVVTASKKRDAVLAVTCQSIDMVIQDMNFAYRATSGDEGISLFYELKSLKPQLPIILITAWGQLENAVELVKAGAVDYLQKPWDDQKLLSTVAEHCGKSDSALSFRDSSLGQAKSEQPTLIYKSEAMAHLVERANRVASADINVLITGANGTGKEKLADHIHAHSTRQDAPFIKVNMGALPQDLMEAELFGAEKGAYTGANEQRQGRFEAADGGTLFLDEIGNLTLAGQMKLLRVLQTGEFERLGSSKTLKVDVRVVSATNADLKLAVNNGTFREDLYYRLNVIELHLTPLKQRKEDILPLAKYMIGEGFEFSERAKSYLLSYHWPGNVRELQNVCERAKIFADKGCIDEGCFASGLKQTTPSEKERIALAIEKHNGVIKHAAEELGLSRQALYRRIDKYQIQITKVE